MTGTILIMSHSLAYCSVCVCVCFISKERVQLFVGNSKFNGKIIDMF